MSRLPTEAIDDAALQPEVVLRSATKMGIEIVDLNGPKTVDQLLQEVRNEVAVVPRPAFDRSMTHWQTLVAGKEFPRRRRR